MTYDWRARTAVNFPQPVATNLGFVTISDDSIAALNNGSLGFRFGLYWPRQIYGRVLRELSAQGAQAVAFDVLFSGRRFDHTAVPVSARNGRTLAEFRGSDCPPARQPATYKDESSGETLTLSGIGRVFRLAAQALRRRRARRGAWRIAACALCHQRIVAG